MSCRAHVWGKDCEATPTADVPPAGPLPGVATKRTGNASIAVGRGQAWPPPAAHPSPLHTNAARSGGRRASENLDLDRSHSRAANRAPPPDAAVARRLHSRRSALPGPSRPGLGSSNLARECAHPTRDLASASPEEGEPNQTGRAKGFGFGRQTGQSSRFTPVVRINNSFMCLRAILFEPPEAPTMRSTAGLSARGATQSKRHRHTEPVTRQPLATAHLPAVPPTGLRRSLGQPAAPRSR